MTRLHALLLFHMLLGSCIASAADRATLCELGDTYVPTASGFYQVSNLEGSTPIACAVPKRPFPTNPKQFRRLQVRTHAYQVLRDGREKFVPSEADVSGEIIKADQEVVEFSLRVPLSSAEQQAEAERYWANVQGSMPTEAHSKEGRRQALARFRKAIYQHRVGRFRVECRMMDGPRVVGIGTVRIEILFRGHFVDWQAEFKPLYNVPTELFDATGVLVPEKPVSPPTGLRERPTDRE